MGEKEKEGREFAGIKFARNPRGSLGPPVRCSGDREHESGERVGKGEEAIHLILRQRRKKKEKEKERERGRGEPRTGILFCPRPTAKLGAIRRDILAARPPGGTGLG